MQGGLIKCSLHSSDTSTKVRSKSESDGINPKCSSKINSPPCKDLEKVKGNLGDRSPTINNEEDSKNRGCSTPKDVLAIDKSPKRYLMPSGYRDPFVGTIDKCSSNSSNPPCTKKKRSAGYGGGYVEYIEVKRNHKVYAQYWYHYEFWSEGNRTIRKSKYIPKRLLLKIERMNREKIAVKGILEVLKGSSKRKK